MNAPYKKIYLQQGIEGERTWEESSVYENDDLYYHSSEVEALKQQLKDKAEKNQLLNERLHKAQMRIKALEELTK